MKQTFNDFIQANPTYKKFEGNSEAKWIFENILSSDENIIKMVEFSDQGKPALSACVLEIENFYENSQKKEFDLTDNFTKQGLGRMVRCVLEPFGYNVSGQKDMPRALNTQYITSASKYTMNNTPRMKILKKIDFGEKQNTEKAILKQEFLRAITEPSASTWFSDALFIGNHPELGIDLIEAISNESNMSEYYTALVNYFQKKFDDPNDSYHQNPETHADQYVKALLRLKLFIEDEDI